MSEDEFLAKLDKLPAEKLISEQHLSVWIGVSLSKIQKDRVNGKGPRFVKADNAVRYRVGDVRKYLSDNTHQSTSTYFATEITEWELGMAPYARVGDEVKDFFDTLDQDVDEIVWVKPRPQSK